MAYKEIHPQQQLRRDHNHQRRGIETPEERRRLERLKQNRESGTQEDALIRHSTTNSMLKDEQEKVQKKNECTVRSDEITDARFARLQQIRVCRMSDHRQKDGLETVI